MENSTNPVNVGAHDAQASEIAAGLNTECMPLPPLVHKFSCYREFLSAFFAYKKNTRTGFSHRRFALLAGLKSPNYLQLVMHGKRNISEMVAEVVADVVGLLGPEKTYFLTLVRLENAKTHEEREEIRKTQLVAVKQIVTVRIPQRSEQIISEWYHLLVRELVFLKNFEPTGAFISNQLNGLISPEQAENSFRSLVQAGLLSWDAAKKCYVACDIVLDTGDHLLHRHLMNRHHKETLHLWAENLADLNSIEQERGLLNIPIASEKIPELREKIRQFQDELIGWLQTEENPDRIVQLGVYLIPFGHNFGSPHHLRKEPLCVAAREHKSKCPRT